MMAAESSFLPPSKSGHARATGILGAVQSLADSGSWIGEAFALRWADVDLAQGEPYIEASVDFRGYRGPTKAGRPRVVELATRPQQNLTDRCPDVFGVGTLVFPSRSRPSIHYQNFPSRVFNRARAAREARES